MSNLEVVKNYTVPKTEVIVDLDASDYFYPTLSCVAAGKNEANDAVSIESSYVNGEKMLKFCFKSEVEGAFGLFSNYYDDYSNYDIYLTSDGKVFATKLGEGGVQNTNVKYELKEMDRVSLILAQAIGCYAYAMAEDGYMTPFADFLALSKEIDKHRDLKVFAGAIAMTYELLCSPDDILCNFHEGLMKY